MSPPEDNKDPVKPQSRRVPTLAEVIEQVKEFLHAALQSSKAKGPAYEATLLYKVNQAKTEAVVAACLSGWHSYLKEIEKSGEEPVDLTDVAVLVIHRTWNRQRRKKYREDQMEKQLKEGRPVTQDGVIQPFDPAAPPWKIESPQDLKEEIALIVEKYSPRDRMVIELRYYDGLSPKEIVDRIQKVMPGVSISDTIISRILRRFKDDLWNRLSEG